MNTISIKTNVKNYFFSVLLALLVSQNIFLSAAQDTLSSLATGIVEEIGQMFLNQNDAKEQKRFKTMILEDAQKLVDLNRQNIDVMRKKVTLADVDAGAVDEKLAEIDSKMKRFKSYIASNSVIEWGQARNLIKEIDVQYTELKKKVNKFVAKELALSAKESKTAKPATEDMGVVGVSMQEEPITHAEGITGIEPAQQGTLPEPLTESLDFNDVN